MSFKGIRAQARLSVPPDLENASMHIGGPKLPNRDPLAEQQPTNEPPPVAEDQSNSDDADNNDKFWKLFTAEAAAEAKWRVNIWKTELDSLLVFAGLFAAVVSAFLVDLRFHLRPDPQVIALKEIASILRNDTAPVEIERPSIPVLAAGSLWYGSLVVTLIGALWGVLAQGWLGEILREPPNNPADGALERWRRDKAAKHWYMENVITGVPLLTQIGLAMFLTGFVVQSFDDNHAIGLGVLVFVSLGAFAYAVFTILPYLRPDCPYRTPLTTFLHLVSNIAPNTATPDKNIDSKIKILVSRLNRSANDEIFCAAASVLDVKLQSSARKSWFKGVEKKASQITDALSVRLQSFAHRVQTITDGPSLSILKDTSGSGTKGEVLVGALYLPIEQGIACLRVLLKSIEVSMSSDEDKSKSPWIKQDINPQWISSEIFPEPWRLLSLSIHITRLVAKQADYGGDDAVEIDWEKMIRPIFPDIPLRSISGASVCRGLTQGRDNLRRLCALGLAMFIEIEVTTPTDLPRKAPSVEEEFVVRNGKVIVSALWRELKKVWMTAVVQLLRDVHEWDNWEPENRVVKLLQEDLYQTNVRSSFSQYVLSHLESTSWLVREQTLQMLVKLSEYRMFQNVVEDALPNVVANLKNEDEDVRAAAIWTLSTFRAKEAVMKKMKAENAIPRFIATLVDHDSDVRAAAGVALRKFSADAFYQDEIKLSIPAVIKQLDDVDEKNRRQAIQILSKLSALDTFHETINSDGAIPRFISKLGDYDPDVCAETIHALQACSAEELYQNEISSSISTIIKLLDDDRWSTRQQAIQILTKLSAPSVSRKPIHIDGAILKFLAKLKDGDSDVRAAAVQALHAFSVDELYQDEIKLSVPIIFAQLDDGNWRIRRQAIQTLMKLSELEVLREAIKTNGIIPVILTKLQDYDSGVRAEAIAALRTFSVHEFYKDEIKSSVPTIIDKLGNNHWTVRREAIRVLTMLSESDAFQDAIKTNEVIPSLVEKLTDVDEDVRAAAVQSLSAVGAQSYFKETMDSQKVLSKLLEKTLDGDDGVRSAAVEAMSTLSKNKIYIEDFKSLISISTFIQQLKNGSWIARQRSVQILTQFATNVYYQEAMSNGETVFTLVNMLKNDHDKDVRAAVAQALSVFGTQESFQEKMKSAKAISQLAAKLVDSSTNVRIAVQSTLLSLSEKEWYENEFKFAIHTIIEQLKDKSWVTRQQVVLILVKLAERPAFQETMKAEGLIPKLVGKLGDSDEDVRAAAAQALSKLSTNGPVKEKMKDERADEEADFLQPVVSTLSALDKSVRIEVYKLLNELRRNFSEDRLKTFLKEVDKNICEQLAQMKDKDLFFIRRLTIILTETAGEGLRGEDLKTPNSTIRDAVEATVKSKLVWDKSSSGNDVVLALSHLAKHDIFRGLMKSAIVGLTEAVGSGDRSIWSVAAGAISDLAKQDEFRADLVQAVQKLVQRLISLDPDEEYPLSLMEVMSALIQYKEFQIKLKRVVPVLLNQLQKDIDNNKMKSDNDNRVAFYKAVCRFISKLCEKEIVGRELLSHLTRVLSKMHVSLINELLLLLDSLIKHGHLTMNDLIALASSLRVASPVTDAFEVRVCKLNMAALLDNARRSNTSPSEYSSFLSAVLGNGNDTIKSKLSTLALPAALSDSTSDIHIDQQSSS